MIEVRNGDVVRRDFVAAAGVGDEDDDGPQARRFLVHAVIYDGAMRHWADGF